MLRCPLSGCSWHAVAPTESSGRERLEEHVIEEHVDVVPADLPAGTVELRWDGEDDWCRVAVDELDED